MTITYFNRLNNEITTNENTEEEEDNIDFSLKMKNAVEVEMIDTDLYMCKELWLPFGSRGAYGGQIVAQSLRAAWDTVPEDFFAHSLHAYFILACDTSIPVIYKIQRVRDGKSFATRIVKATQRGKAIFTCSCSFVKPDETSIQLTHQTDMPEVTEPENLLSDVEIFQQVLESNAAQLPERFRKKMIRRIKDDLPVDYRGVAQLAPDELVTGKVPANQYSQRWFKTRGGLDDDLKLHACIIAYASDSGFITTAAAANGYTINSESIGMIASLDHSMWFHVPTRADEWLLYDVHSPRTHQGRGMAFGKIYNRQGILVATTAQEGVVRLSQLEQKRRLQMTDNNQSRL